MTRIDRHTEGLCCVCRGRDAGIAVKSGGRLRWVCADADCLDIAIRSDNVSAKDFDRLEAEAAIVGAGNAMGAFLDEIGITDMAALAPEQWAELCKRGTAGYRQHLKKLVDDNAIPF